MMAAGLGFRCSAAGRVRAGLVDGDAAQGLFWQGENNRDSRLEYDQVESENVSAVDGDTAATSQVGEVFVVMLPQTTRLGCVQLRATVTTKKKTRGVVLTATLVFVMHFLIMLTATVPFVLHFSFGDGDAAFPFALRSVDGDSAIHFSLWLH